jgi:two-component system, chemotaxis family, chemotaxis protein CheY
MDLQVLIVDDNGHMRTILRELLRAVGIREAREARDAVEALDIMKSSPMDLILVDLSMPVIDGVEFTRMVRTSSDSPNPYVPIVMITGHSARSKVTAARDAGVTEFVAKPVTAKSLLERLQAIVERPRPFVKTALYFGPDRRRRNDPEFAGPFRRAADKDREAQAI